MICCCLIDIYICIFLYAFVISPGCDNKVNNMWTFHIVSYIITFQREIWYTNENKIKRVVAVMEGIP